MRKPIRCGAVLAKQYRNQQPWIKLCENAAVITYDGVPLCGTHVNTVPALVCVEPMLGFGTVVDVNKGEDHAKSNKTGD